jgi:hypothetical protein
MAMTAPPEMAALVGAIVPGDDARSLRRRRSVRMASSLPDGRNGPAGGGSIGKAQRSGRCAVSTSAACASRTLRSRGRAHRLRASADFPEGVAALREKRQPRYE